MKQPRHFYNLESKTNRDGTKLIYFNFSYGAKRVTTRGYKNTPLRISTQWKIKPEYWSKETNRATATYISKFGRTINTELERLEDLTYNALDLYRREHKKDPSIERLKEIIEIELGRREESTNLIKISDYIQEVIDYRTNLEPTVKLHWKPNNAKQYSVLIKHIEAYERKTKNILYLSEFTEELYWDFFEVINEIYKAENGRGYLKNTISKICKKLKAILTYAANNGETVGMNPSNKLTTIQPVESQHSTYLTEEQLETIIETDVNHSKEFTNARNYILISSLTGLRIEDMVHIHQLPIEELKTANSTLRVIRTEIRKAEKHGRKVTITIPLPKALNEFKQFPRFTDEVVIRRNVKKFLKFLNFNDQIEVTELCYKSPPVITLKPQFEVFRCHDCRATYVSNLLHYVSRDLFTKVTHPKIGGDIIDLYDKRQNDKIAIQLATELNRTESTVYQY